MNMQLADCIRKNIEPILHDWEEFAETLSHASHMNQAELRDHARDMLLVIADDIETPQNESEQTAKSKGDGPEPEEESWAEVHGVERQISGFSVWRPPQSFGAFAQAWCQTGPGLTRRLPSTSLRTLPGSTKP